MYDELPIKKLTRAEVHDWRVKTVVEGFGLPLLIALIFFFIKKDEILWPFTDKSNLKTTSGVITVSQVDYKSGPRSSGWYFDIKYQYQVDEKIYLSDRIRYSYFGSKEESFAEGYVAKYPIGSTVIVYYDPDLPQKAVLEPYVYDYSGLYIIGFILLYGVSIASLSFWIR